MKKFQIYLAGGMGNLSFEEQNKWRKTVFEMLAPLWISPGIDFDIVNPVDYFNFQTKKHETEREVMEFDLWKVRNSDLIIVNFNDPHSLGTMAEMAIAYEHRIPILGLNLSDVELHPWQIEMTNRIFNDMDSLIDYTIEFYLN